MNDTLILFDIDDTLTNDIGLIGLLIGKKTTLKIPGLDKKLTNLKKKYTLGIWSRGFKNIQLFKLKTTGILEYFSNNQIWISLRKTNLLKQINNQDFRKVIIVDDKDFSRYTNKYPKMQLINTNDLTNLNEK